MVSNHSLGHHHFGDFNDHDQGLDQDQNETTGHPRIDNPLSRFSEAYEQVHLPLTTMICVFGIVANTLNVIVLTRRSMISPTNAILTGLSVAQLLLLLNYLSLTIFNICASSCLLDFYTYPAASYKWINVNMNVAFHTTAFGHTLVLAVFRFLAVHAPTVARSNLNLRMARVCLMTLYVVGPMVSALAFLTSYVTLKTDDNECGMESYYDLDYSSDKTLLEVSFMVFLVLKLVPSLIITVLSFSLIVSLKRYKKRKAALTGKQWTRDVGRPERKPLLAKVTTVDGPSTGQSVCQSSHVDWQQQQLSQHQEQTSQCLLPAQQQGKSQSQQCQSPSNKLRNSFRRCVFSRTSECPSGTKTAPATGTETGTGSASSTNNNHSNGMQPYSKQTQMTGTRRVNRYSLTRMLVAVALLCASVELPHAIMYLLTSVFGDSFGRDVYDQVGDIFEMLTLLYSAVNFVLYCIMSTEFRRTFARLFFYPLRDCVERKLLRKTPRLDLHRPSVTCYRTSNTELL